MLRAIIAVGTVAVGHVSSISMVVEHSASIQPYPEEPPCDDDTPIVRTTARPTLVPTPEPTPAQPSLEYMGVWGDAADPRAMTALDPINVWGLNNRVRNEAPRFALTWEAAVHKVASLIINQGQSEGYIAIQDVNSMGWQVGPGNAYQMHGFVGWKSNQSNGGQINNGTGVVVPGYDGMLKDFGGYWENAVYRIKLPHMVAPPAPTPAPSPNATYRNHSLVYTGVWKDKAQSRAMKNHPCSVLPYINGRVGNQVPRFALAYETAVEAIATEITNRGQSEGYIAIQDGNQIWWQVGPGEAYQRHGFVGLKSNATNGGQLNGGAGVVVPGYDGGMLKEVGGVLENAVYHITLK